MLKKLCGVIICIAVSAAFSCAHASFLRWFGFGTDNTNVMINSTHNHPEPCPPHKAPVKPKHKHKHKHKGHKNPKHHECFWWRCR